MDIKVITTFDNANKYVMEAEHDGSNLQKLWQKYMIEPYWADISQWAPFDLSHMKPSCIQNLGELKKQLAILSEISIDSLYTKFMDITKALPKDDEDPIIVALYPLDDGNRIVKERQNGVVGSCVFGNIIVNINPLAKDYQDWIPYVFAHEYHHCVWGYHWFVLRKGQGLDGSFLEYMINEGQADAFAESLFPRLTPQWNRGFDTDTEINLWERVKPILFSKDRQIHSQYMFGDKDEGLPWCMGYSFGRTIISDYLQKHRKISFAELINIPAKEILYESRYSV